MGMGWKYLFLKKHVWLGHPSVENAVIVDKARVT